MNELRGLFQIFNQDASNLFTVLNNIPQVLMFERDDNFFQIVFKFLMQILIFLFKFLINFLYSNTSANY